MKIIRVFLITVAAVALVSFAAEQAPAQGKSDGKGKDKKEEKEQKKLDKEAKKLEKKTGEVERGLGRDVVFCILAAHTDVGTAEELKASLSPPCSWPTGSTILASASTPS
jgi:hypothetical protein